MTYNPRRLNFEVMWARCAFLPESVTHAEYINGVEY